jgi:hypothetical protein
MYACAPDFTGDGYLDIATQGGGYFRYGLHVNMAATDPGLFASVVTSATPNSWGRLVPGDWDGDGIASDALIFPASYSFGAYISKVGLRLNTSYNIGNTNVVDVCACDMDNDGINDLLYTVNYGGYYIYWRATTLAPFGPTFHEEQTICGLRNPKFCTLVDSPSIMACGDLDGDGDSDFAIPSRNGLYWFENAGIRGNYTYTMHSVGWSVSSSTFRDIVVVDVDSDGDLDVLVSVCNANAIVLYESQGTPSAPVRSQTFTARVLYSPTACVRIDVIDMNMDGLVDIILTGESPGVKFTWLEQLDRAEFAVATFQPRRVPSVSSDDFAIFIRGIDFDRDGDRDLVVVTSNPLDYSESVLVLAMLIENRLCPAGWWGTLGEQPCLPCPAGTDGRWVGLGSQLCGGQCQPGRYSLEGSAPGCVECPIGRYGDASGLGSTNCSGACTTTPGFMCGPGATSALGTPCPAGAFGSGPNECSPCPVGVYGNSTGLAAAACSGACVAVPGRYCGVSMTTSDGEACPPGSFTSDAGRTFCTPCPAGLYAPLPGSAVCGGVCLAASGMYCVEGQPSAGAGAVCPPGQFSSGGNNVTVCSPCNPGRFGNTTGLGNASCTAPCPLGRYSGGGRILCDLCPAGVFGNQTGLTTAACSGQCASASGWYCPVGATSSVPLACPPGSYSNASGAAVCTPCTYPAADA